MESSLQFLLLLIGILAFIHIVQAQSQQGFISLDCGLPANETYKEETTGLQFFSDATFIHSGETDRVQDNRENVNLLRPYTTLRYFPEGIRNCYNLPVEKGRKHLIRAWFVYGNYDGSDSSPKFDLYLGPNLWSTIDLYGQKNGTREEILHIPTSNTLQICLVKTEKTIPMISALEIRPLGKDSYITTSGSLILYFRLYLTNSTNYLRFPNDVYDRQWIAYSQTVWTHISTALNVRNSNHYVPAEDALKHAATPTKATAPLTIEWSSENTDDQYYFYPHFAEIQDLQAKDTREFNILFNAQYYYGPQIPDKLAITTIHVPTSRTCDGGKCSFQLVRTNRSTLPPLLNALEVYTVIQFPQSETDESDVKAVKNINATYGLSRINWQGDPCFPQDLRWDGLDCSSTNMSIPPRITTLNLSSSDLTGTIAASIQNLTQLKKLDLSNNSLTGEVPEFLGNMKSLLVINLNGNDLNGSIPQSLQRKGLKLSFQGNRRLLPSSSPTKRKSILVPILASVGFAAILVVVLVLFQVFRKKKLSNVNVVHPTSTKPTLSAAYANSPEPSFEMKKRRFTYSEVIKMTNNCERVIGEGGFGVVFHGTVNGSEQVAVKLLSHSPTQGYKEFKAEVDLLLRVHHTNLVSLVGYCNEGEHLALIYEFVPNGD